MLVWALKLLPLLGFCFGQRFFDLYKILRKIHLKLVQKGSREEAPSSLFLQNGYDSILLNRLAFQSQGQQAKTAVGYLHWLREAVALRRSERPKFLELKGGCSQSPKEARMD